jgi:hypothetical protein
MWPTDAVQTVCKWTFVIVAFSATWIVLEARDDVFEQSLRERRLRPADTSLDPFTRYILADQLSAPLEDLVFLFHGHTYGSSVLNFETERLVPEATLKFRADLADETRSFDEFREFIEERLGPGTFELCIRAFRAIQLDHTCTGMRIQLAPSHSLEYAATQLLSRDAEADVLQFVRTTLAPEAVALRRERDDMDEAE